MDHIPDQTASWLQHSMTFSQHGELVVESAKDIRMENAGECLLPEGKGSTVNGRDVG